MRSAKDEPSPENQGTISEEELALIANEGLTLAEAAKLIPSRKPGKRVDVNTVWRWCQKGLKGGFRLRSVLVSGTRYTTRTWLREFIQARNQASNADQPTVPCPRGQQQRQAASDRAAEELRRRWGAK